MSITNLSKLEKDLDNLIEIAVILLYSMGKECNKLDKETEKYIKDSNIKLLDFKSQYEKWYSEAMQLIKQILPDRYNDFIELYKMEKRKEVTHATYTISDYMIGLRTTLAGQVKVDVSAAIPKYMQQMNILKSAKQRFKSSLFEIRQLVQADIFDDELQSASQLLKHKFLRGAGVVAGVVLEKHLGEVCRNHNIKIAKKNPVIADFNDILKDGDVLDIPQWRFIQRLGDIRNLCGHNKDREPTDDEVQELISGVQKVTKTIY